MPSTSRPGPPSTCTASVVCPGFIDIHTHYDAQLLWDPTASPSVLHGVTTVLGGNCGFSIAPLGPGDAPYIQRMMAVVEGIPLEALEGGGAWEWTSFGEYLDRVDVGLAVNAGFLVGHSTVRRAVMGEAATEGAADAGAARMPWSRWSRSRWPAGRSGSPRPSGRAISTATGRPVPSRAAAFDEFVALAGAVRDHPGTTLEFIPTVGPIPEERMELMADMSLAADRPLNWNLLGSLASEEIYEQQLEASDLAAAKGAHVVALALPDMMRMRSSNLLPGLPGWREVLTLDRAPAVGRGGRPGHPGRAAGRGREGGGQGHGRAVRLPPHGGGRPRVRVGRAARWATSPPSRGTDVVDVLIDVVLVDGLTLFVVLPSLTPSLGTDRRGLGGPGGGVEGPAGDARGLGRRCPPRPDVPRQLPDGGARRGGAGPGAARRWRRRSR